MIYLDNNASTPIAPSVQAAMKPFLAEHYGNPSSGHWAGVPAAQAVARAREQLAALLGCSPGEVVLTSGGTEANNTALKGVAEASGRERPHVVTTAVEHPAIVEPCRYLERHGVEVSFVGVDTTGRVDPDDIAAAIRPETVLVGLHPSATQLVLPDRSTAFQGAGGPKALLAVHGLHFTQLGRRCRGAVDSMNVGV